MGDELNLPEAGRRELQFTASLRSIVPVDHLEIVCNGQVVKSLPLKGTVGHLLSFEQFLTHMLHQARASARLRSLQERKYRTAAFAAP